MMDLKSFIQSAVSENGSLKLYPNDIATAFEDFGVAIDDIAFALMEVAKLNAITPLSGYRVAAVGYDGGLNCLIAGVNVEFEELSQTVHAEQCMMANAAANGLTISTIYVSAPPCGHCRQFLNEFEITNQATVVFRDINCGIQSRRLQELLPLSFGPEHLGQEKASIERESPVGIEVAMLKQTIAGSWKIRTNRNTGNDCWAYVPYTGQFHRTKLLLEDGSFIVGAPIENAAYNPSLRSSQVAICIQACSTRGFKPLGAIVIHKKENSAATDVRLIEAFIKNYKLHWGIK